jgi:hypothetical protein
VLLGVRNGGSASGDEVARDLGNIVPENFVFENQGESE